MPPPSDDPNALAPVTFFPRVSQFVLNGGGSGLIFAQYTTDILAVTASANCQGIACVLVDLDTGKRIYNYWAATSSAVAKIEPASTVTGKDIMAPKVASFSSRGPSPDYPDIIKPDIAAPGANILAAKEGSYVFKSGTSMAAPHVSGIVAVLKAMHPHWSPAAMKSAIVTSAHVTDERGMSILQKDCPRRPPVLVFNAANKVHTSKVTLSPAWKLQGDYTFGSITWRSDRKTVRIPVAARITAQDFYADVA